MDMHRSCEEMKVQLLAGTFSDLQAIQANDYQTLSILFVLPQNILNLVRRVVRDK
jgi:hypothetical protein